MSSNPASSRLRQAFYPAADRVESWLCREAAENPVRPIIVLGPPRSGTTLFYQYFADLYRVSWFSNLADKKARWPCLATWLVHRKIATYRSDYSSQYGTTEGVAGPAEARRLWSHWFTYDYADESVTSDRVNHCRRVVGYVTSLTGLPFISKNPDHCIRCRALDVAFPDAIYVRIRRDPLAVARSILNARLNYLGSYDRWFGVRPPEIAKETSLPVTDQALLQVAHLENRLDNEFSSIIRPDHQVIIDYDRFCDAPTAECKKVEAAARSCGVDLRQKNMRSDTFQKSAGKPLPERMEEALRRSVAAGILQVPKL